MTPSKTEWTLTLLPSITVNETPANIKSIHPGAPSDPCPHHTFTSGLMPLSKAFTMILNAAIDSCNLPGSLETCHSHRPAQETLGRLYQALRLQTYFPLIIPIQGLREIHQQMPHSLLVNHQLLHATLSSFRPHNTTETALNAATHDICMILDRGETAALFLLDL